MAIDIREISLTHEQKQQIARLAEQSGKSWNEVIDERLAVTDRSTTTGQLAVYPDRYMEDREKWLEYFEHWRAQRKSYNPHFDDSRESIYPDRI